MRSERRHSGLHPLATVGLAALAIAGCGGSETPGAGGSDGGGDRAKLERAALEHAECMRKEGIDVPDPKPGEGGIVLRGPRDGDGGAQRRAVHKCDKHLRDLPAPKLSDQQKNAMRDGALEHARCMRGQGIDFPDPTFDDKGRITVKLGDGFDPADPRTRRAEQKCRKLLPRPGAEPLG